MSFTERAHTRQNLMQFHCIPAQNMEAFFLFRSKKSHRKVICYPYSISMYNSCEYKRKKYGCLFNPQIGIGSRCSGNHLTHDTHLCQGRRPQSRLRAKYIHKTVRTVTDRARYDWLLLQLMQGISRNAR